VGVTVSKILPQQTLLSEPYWTGCREGKLRLQQCDACEQYQFYPRIFCSHCGHRELSWRAVSGRGRIASYTVIHRPISDAYPAPSVIVLVDLEEGPRMMSSLVDTDPESVSVGAAVSVDFDAWSEEISVPVFRIVAEGSHS
jgi:uncharacterized OB-fold protein